MKHELNCNCLICKLSEKNYQFWEQEQIKKYGFFVHSVFDATDCPNGINIHTHGIKEIFNHIDFQICIGVSPNIAMGIFHQIVNLIKEGKSFVAGKKYSTIVEYYNTEFINARECGRDVLRLVVPNKKGTYEGEIYQAQFLLTGL